MLGNSKLHHTAFFVVVNSQLHHTIKNGFLLFGVHWYTSQWKLSFGWEPIASTYNGTCFFCRESTVAADDEHLFRGVGNHRYDIQWVMCFLWLGIHSYSIQWYSLEGNSSFRQAMEHVSSLANARLHHNMGHELFWLGIRSYIIE